MPSLPPTLSHPHTLTSSPSHTEHVDHIVVGTVIQEVKTSNVAREVSNHPPISHSLHSHTLSTHSPHRLQWSQGSRTTFLVTQSQWRASPPTLPLQQVPNTTLFHLLINLPPSHPSPLTHIHTLKQVFVRLPQDRVTW